MGDVDHVRRRVQLTGGSTYTVSLPIDWVRSSGIGRGDEVAVLRQGDGSLLISPRQLHRAERSSATLSLSPEQEPGPALRLIISHYLAGYDSIRLRFPEGFDSRSRRGLKDAIRQRIIALEVMEESGDELLLRSLLNDEELALPQAIRQMSELVKAMQRDALAALRRRAENLARDVIQRDFEVDRFYLLIVRQLKAAARSAELARRLGLESPAECLGYRIIVRSMERVADHAENIARNTLRLRSRRSPLFAEVQKMGEAAYSVFDASLGCLFSRDAEEANRIIDRVPPLIAMETQLKEKLLQSGLSVSDQMGLHAILDSMRRTAGYGADIAEILLNLSVKAV